MIFMTHKVHPKAYRIKDITDWDSRGAYYKKSLPQNLKEDFQIRKILDKRLKDCWVERVEIERYPGKISIIITSARPGLIIGRGGAGAEELKKILIREISRQRKEAKSISPKDINIEIKEVKDIWVSPRLVMDWIARRLEKRTPFRRVIKQALEKVMATRTVKGVRIEVSGRLDGVEISRNEWVQKGNLPRQTIRADIEYAFGEAHCSYGLIGIKVWVYKGERFA